MSLTTLWLWCLVLYLVQAQSDTVVATTGFRDVDSGVPINITEWCKESPCITKCCPANKIIFKNTSDSEDAVCFDSKTLALEYGLTNLHNYSDVKIYDKYIKPTDKKFEYFKRIYRDDFADYFIDFPIDMELYIIENGQLLNRRRNYLKQWSPTDTGKFCVEFALTKTNGIVDGNPKLTLWFEPDPSEDSNTDDRNVFTACGMLVSCVFLVLVLAVYASLPQLRNLAGLMVMAYVATLSTGFMFRVVQVFISNYGLIDMLGCQFIGILELYTVVASFTWMNVMSFDIWWSLRGFCLKRQIHRRGILVKFGWYTLYGWGAPLVLVLFIVTVDHIDMTDWPDFIQPHVFDGKMCYMPEDERQVYMNGPILITTCINIMLFLMTAFNIWRIKRGVVKHSAGESKKNEKDQNRFGIYLKLSFIMGISWILEVVGSVYHSDSLLWYIPDMYNCLTGMFIFFIFIFKRKIFVLLCKRYAIENRYVQKWQPVDSTRTTSSTCNSTRANRIRKLGSV